MKRVAPILVLASLGLVGCTSYYKVTDTSTGKIYYTQDLRQSSTGSTTLKDGKTGAEVTVQNTSVEKIDKEQYDVARYSQPASGDGK